MTVCERIALGALAAGLLSTTALAQGAKCEIEEGKPNQVKDARNAIVKGGLVTKPEERTKQFTTAVRLLSDNPEKIGNPVGRNFLLGRALVSLAAQPDMAPVVKRSAAGYAQDPEGTVDLLAAADSAFDAVETAMPQCEGEVEQHRRIAYVPLVNAAVNLYNAKQVDSAVKVAERTLLIYPKSPIAHNVLGNAAHQKEDFAGAVAHFRKMLEAIGNDTAYAEEKKGTMLNIAALLAAQADRAQGAAKATLAKETVAAYEAYLKEYPGDARAQSGLARAQLLSGDSTSAAKLFSEMVSNPAQYSDIQLFEAGVNAARAERGKEAAQLFEAGLKKNPYYRDGLFNLAATYFSMDEIDKMPPVLTRLVEVDPNNPENWRLWAGYYQGKAKATKETAAKRALNDSTVKYFKMWQEPTVKVSFNQFSHDGAKHTLGGTIENLSAAAASYDLKVDFLDASGKVVTSQQARVEAVDPKGSKPFTITADGEGIVAFKYASLAK